MNDVDFKIRRIYRFIVLKYIFPIIGIVSIVIGVAFLEMGQLVPSIACWVISVGMLVTMKYIISVASLERQSTLLFIIGLSDLLLGLGLWSLLR